MLSLGAAARRPAASDAPREAGRARDDSRGRRPSSPTFASSASRRRKAPSARIASSSRTSTMPAYSLDTTPGGPRAPRAEEDAAARRRSRRRSTSRAYSGPLRTVTTVDGRQERATHRSRSIATAALKATVAVDGEDARLVVRRPEAAHVAIAASRRRASARTVAREDAPTDGPKIETSIHDGETTDGAKVERPTGGGEAGFAATSTSRRRAGRYNGRRIDLDLKDADIHNILRLLADVGHVNIVTADDVARQRHDPHAQRALGPGARRRAPGQGPRHGAAGQPDPRRAARRRSQKERELRHRRGASRSSSSRRSRRASSRSATRRPTSSRRAPRTCSRRAARSPSTSAPTCSSRATSPAT